MKLTQQQIDFFGTFGFIKFPELFKEEIAGITEEFEQVFPMFEGKHDGNKRTCIVPFVDQREKLSALLDDARIAGIAAGLLGENFNYMGSDGNFYTGDTSWHRDGEVRERRHIKMAFYLDELSSSTGALRVIPGSHRLDDQFGKDLKKTYKHMDAWGIVGDEVPAITLDVVPGDLLVFDHNTFHSSWGGSKSRRMFTLNLCERYTEQTLDKLKEDIVIHGHFHRNHYYGPAMLHNASPQRLIHLEQVISVSANYEEMTKDFPELPRRIR